LNLKDGNEGIQQQIMEIFKSLLDLSVSSLSPLGPGSVAG